jgi:hypothetical protein
LSELLKTFDKIKTIVVPQGQKEKAREKAEQYKAFSQLFNTTFVLTIL